MKKLWFLFLVIASINANAATEIRHIQGRALLSQKSIKMELTKNKATVVLFLSASCPCSNSHINELKNLSQKFKDISFIAVHSNTNETKKQATDYFTAIKLPFPVIQDTKTKIADQFRALKTPHAFLLNSKGEVVYQGGVSNSNDAHRANKFFLRDALEDLSKEKEIRTPEGRTLGCVISRNSQ